MDTNSSQLEIEGGRVPARPSLEVDPTNLVQEVLKGISNSKLGEDWSHVRLCMLIFQYPLFPFT